MADTTTTAAPTPSHCRVRRRPAFAIGSDVAVGGETEIVLSRKPVGSAAIAHLLPFIDHVDMDGPLLLEEDLATGISYDFGKIKYSDKPGLGIDYTGVFLTHKSIET